MAQVRRAMVKTSIRTKSSAKSRARKKRKTNQKFNPLLYAKKFNPFLSSTTLQAKNLVDSVFAEMREQGNFLTAHDLERRKRHLEAVLLNLYAACSTNPKRYVSIGLGQNPYSVRDRYSPKWTSGPIVRALIKALGPEGLDYIEIKKGFKDRGNGIGYQTRIRATSALSEKFDAAGLIPEMVQHTSDLELIRLKNKDKKLIEYTDSHITDQMRSDLAKINTKIAVTFIGLHLPNAQLRAVVSSGANESDELDDDDAEPVDFTNRYLYRVFNNGSFECGGRFYGGWWQSVPSQLRKHIYIAHRQDRRPAATRELDYSSVQPTLAYALSKQEPPPDAYRVKHLPDSQQVVLRPVFKAAMLRMLNTQSPVAAAESLEKWYKRNNGDQYSLRPNKVVEMLEEAHPVLLQNKMFYGKVGKELMYRDSRIAERVMLDMLGKGIVALPVHDSFLVMRHYDSELESSMKEAFRAETGFSCKVTPDKTECEAKADALESALAATESSKAAGKPDARSFREVRRDRQRCSMFWTGFQRWLRVQP
jgi:hypothetical protein